MLAAERGAAGERYVISGATISSREALEHRLRISGRAARRQAPAAAVRARRRGGWSRAPSARAASTPPVCREMVRTLLHGHRYDGSRAVRELGLEYTPVADTFRRTIDVGASREGSCGAAAASSGARAGRPVRHRRHGGPAWSDDDETARGTTPRARRRRSRPTEGFETGFDQQPDTAEEEREPELRPRHRRGGRAGQRAPRPFQRGPGGAARDAREGRSSAASARASRRARRATRAAAAQAGRGRAQPGARVERLLDQALGLRGRGASTAERRSS